MKEDLRVVKTKRTLKNALLELLKEETFEKISVSKICSQAKVNRVTFYTHFQDKYDLFQSYIDDMKNGILKSLTSTMSKKETSLETLAEFFYLLFSKMIDAIYEKKEILIRFGNQENSMLMYMINSSAYKSLKEIFLVVQKDYNLKYDIDYIVSFIIGGTSYIVYNWIQQEKMSEIEHFKKQIKNFLLDLNQSKILFEDMRNR